MKEKELKKLKEVKLSDSEKQKIFASITERTRKEFPEVNLNYPVISPFQRLYFGMHLKVLVLSFLLLFTTGATAFASLDSLPGDLLYGVKTNIVEKVPEIIRRNPEKKASDNAKRIEKRIVEFEKLAEEGRLTEKNSRKIEGKINKDLEKFDRNLTKIKAREKTNINEPKRKINLEKELESKIEKHKEKIHKIRENEKTPDKKALQSVLDRIDSRRNSEESAKQESRDIKDDINLNR